MRKYISVAILASVLSVFSFAHAAEKTAGTLLSIDLESGTLMMSDDITYNLPAGFEDPGFSAGDDVVILWYMMNDEPMVQTINAFE
ncbi:MAG: hypothetical protein ACI9UN_002881 [Granulosicoccus sp.]|jgi:hypothetical protein